MYNQNELKQHFKLQFRLLASENEKGHTWHMFIFEAILTGTPGRKSWIFLKPFVEKCGILVKHLMRFLDIWGNKYCPFQCLINCGAHVGQMYDVVDAQCMWESDINYFHKKCDLFVHFRKLLILDWHRFDKSLKLYCALSDWNWFDILFSTI